MDDIWKNATRKARAHKKRAATHSAVTTATIPAAAAAVTTFSTATENTTTSPALMEEDMNTVKKLDEKLARMEQHWAETRSGPFPEGVRNAIADLRASLERDTETAPTSKQSDLADVQHVTTTTATISAPTSTATPTIYEITTTPERLDHVANTRHVIAQPPPIPAEQKGIEETQSKVQDPVIAPTAVKPAPHKHARFDWASEVDKAYGHSPVNHNAATANPD